MKRSAWTRSTAKDCSRDLRARDLRARLDGLAASSCGDARSQVNEAAEDLVSTLVFGRNRVKRQSYAEVWRELSELDLVELMLAGTGQRGDDRSDFLGPINSRREY